MVALQAVQDFKPVPAAAPPAAPRRRRPLDAVFEAFGTVLTMDRGVEVFAEGEPAEHYFQVVDGAVSTYTILQDGRRQIGAFHLPRAVFGLEAEGTHAFSAEAIARSRIRTVKRAAVLAMAARDSDLANDLFCRAASSLRQAHRHLLLLGRKNAEERVASFLLDLADRRSVAGVIELPMSRQEIADYLGLTIETVSRTLTALENKAVIELPSSRRVHVRSRGTLQRLDA